MIGNNYGNGIRKGMADFKVALTAGNAVRVNRRGDYWQIIEASAAVKLTFDDGQSITRKKGLGGPGLYNWVEISSDVDQPSVTVSLGICDGTPPYDSRAIFDGVINVATNRASVISPLADVTTAAGVQSLLVAADATRLSLTIRLPSTATGNVRIGDSTTAAGKGALLEPGDSITIDGTAAIYLFNEGAAPATVSLLTGTSP